jgi:8-oxo-dGTP pyrophosphatase MutT (NUDIX family)
MTEVTARPAATVLLVRDGDAGLEVFMVVRNREIDFAGGALVFPGGRVEQDDVAIAGGEGLDAFRIAGIRETFEECGVLLARPPGCPVMIGAQTLLRLEDSYRAAMNRGEGTLSAMLRAENLVPAVDAMVHFAHWITPLGRAKRFDTQFFLAAAPPDQVAVHDGSESVESVWIRPADAVRETNEGTRTLVFATRKVLEKLARFASVDEALAAAAGWTVVTVMPELAETPTGWRLRIPPEADYGGEFFETLDKPAIGARKPA